MYPGSLNETGINLVLTTLKVKQFWSNHLFTNAKSSVTFPTNPFQLTSSTNMTNMKESSANIYSSPLMFYSWPARLRTRNKVMACYVNLLSVGLLLVSYFYCLKKCQTNRTSSLSLPFLEPNWVMLKIVISFD